MRPRLLFLSFLLSLGSGLSHAHSGDLVLARLRLQNSDEVVLELTADVEANPLLKSEPNPSAKLGTFLRVVLPSGRSWDLHKLGKPQISLSSGFDKPTPVPLAHPQGEPEREHYTASWKWRPSETPLRIENIAPNAQPILFWSTPPTSETVLDGWRLLQSGEQSPQIHLPSRPAPFKWNWKAGAAIAVALLGLAGNALFIVHRILLQKARNQKSHPSGAR